MNELCMVIKQTVIPNFMNIRAALQAYDRDALFCGAPCWRWAYHTLHSADKWFFNPFVYEEPAFHEAGMDNPYHPCSIVLTDGLLMLGTLALILLCLLQLASDSYNPFIYYRF